MKIFGQRYFCFRHREIMAKMKNFATVTGYLTRTLIMQQSVSFCSDESSLC